MLFPGVKKLGKFFGLVRSNSVAMGNIDNSYIRLYDGNNQKVLEFFFPKLEIHDKNEINELLKNNNVKKYEWSGDTVIITFPEYFKPYPVKNIRNIITQLSNYSSIHYPNGKVACQKCNLSTEANSYSLGNVSLYLCSDCFKNLEFELANKKSDYEAIPKNYFFGTIGALLFSIPGIIVTALIFVFLNRIAALSAVIYVLLATKGYLFFKGKTDKIGALILTLTGLVVSYFGIIISYGIMILYKTKSIPYTFELLQNNDIQKEMRTNLYIGLFVCSLYLLFNLITLLSEWKFPVLKKAKEI